MLGSTDLSQAGISDTIKTSHLSCNDTMYCFQHIYSRTSKTYIRLRRQPTLIIHHWQKTPVTDNSTKQLQTQMDADRVYNEDCMRIYKEIVGNGFTMPGGLDVAKKWLSTFQLDFKGSVVLDVGCGAGGVQSYLMETFDADVTGIDLSVLACQSAVLRLAELQKEKGSVQIMNLSKANFPSDLFDIILVKDTLEYTECYQELLVKCKQWLKPNGKLLIGGCFKGQNAKLDDKAGKPQGGLCITSAELTQALESNGYGQILSVNLSNFLIGCIEKDLEKLKANQNLTSEVKSSFIQQWSDTVSSLKAEELEWVATSAVIIGSS